MSCVFELCQSASRELVSPSELPERIEHFSERRRESQCCLEAAARCFAILRARCLIHNFSLNFSFCLEVGARHALAFFQPILLLIVY